jgi:L-ascorbate metabolism protein UlaG (beta-lactamase superfamily)
LKITFLGHSTVVIEMDGVRLLTDPFLRGRLGHLRRRSTPVDLDEVASVDVILISHLHHDHFDPASLKMIDRSAVVIVPQGARRVVDKLGFERVEELPAGEQVTLGGIDVRATPASHDGKRGPFGPDAEAVGYLVTAGQRIYFAGDTDLFDEMKDIGPNLDLALLPVWGWGPKLGRGHLDPRRAAEALTLLTPRVAIPIHWGTLSRIGLGRAGRHLLTDPPHRFAGEAARLAPEVEVRIVQPGDSVTFG